MRRFPLLLALLALAALVAAGCGGPKDPKAALVTACERQIKEVEEGAHSGTTREATSTKEFVEDEQLVECAGQPALTATAGSADGEDGAEHAEGEGDSAGDGEAPTPALDEAALAAERDTFAKTCASCHTLADAEATGSFGPDLDTSTMTVEDMTAQIENGGGGMPPALLSGDDAAQMAAYLDSVRAG